MKKDSQLSILVTGFAFLFAPFLGFFFKIFCVRFLLAFHLISVLENHNTTPQNQEHTSGSVQ